MIRNYYFNLKAADKDYLHRITAENLNYYDMNT